MKIKKSELKNILKEELSELTGNDTSKLEDLLEDLLDQLGKLDVSIDYLAASFTGEDPMNINISQTGLGRLKQAPMAKTKVQEKADIVKKQLKDLIKEIVSEKDFSPLEISKAVQSDQDLEILLATMAEKISDLEAELDRRKKEYANASARFSQITKSPGDTKKLQGVSKARPDEDER